MGIFDKGKKFFGKVGGVVGDIAANVGGAVSARVASEVSSAAARLNDSHRSGPKAIPEMTRSGITNSPVAISIIPLLLIGVAAFVLLRRS